MKIHPINLETIAKAEQALPPENLLRVVVQIFAAMGDSTRAKILYAVRKQEMSVRDLAILIKISDSAVSHQLSYLKARHLVKSRRDKNIIYYTLSFRHLSALLKEAEYYADHLRNKLPDHPYDEV